VSVVLPADLDRSIGAFQAIGVDVIPLPLRKVFWHPRSVFSLVRLVGLGSVRAPDVVHIHSQEAGLLGRATAWMGGAKAVVYTPQVVDIRRARWHWLYVLAEHLLAHVTDVVISVSEADRERMIRWGIPARKIVHVPNAVDLNGADGCGDAVSVREALGLDEGRPLVMQVGRLSAQKNPLAFVDGAARVIRERPDAQFLLVGEGPMREAVALHAEALGLDGAVRLLGWQDNAADLMVAADVVSLTSEWEGMPHALLEAMVKSRPVVATAVNGCPEIVADGETGFLVPRGDVDSWAKRVIDLLNDPVRRDEMGRRGRDRVEDVFSLERMVSCIEGLYLRVSNAG
jgi:glycosyltransferase involved in cell wall biosynthesis